MSESETQIELWENDMVKVIPISEARYLVEKGKATIIHFRAIRLKTELEMSEDLEKQQQEMTKKIESWQEEDRHFHDYWLSGKPTLGEILAKKERAKHE